MQYVYNTVGTCSKQIMLDIDENGVIQEVKFLGGCNGNLQGIGALVKGQKMQDVAAKLKGINCGMKGTSCPDQLAHAILAIQAQQAK